MNFILIEDNVTVIIYFLNRPAIVESGVAASYKNNNTITTRCVDLERRVLYRGGARVKVV